MADKTQKRRFCGFWLGMGIYVCVLLTAVLIGLACLWNYLTAYEASRPQTAVNDYMQSLTGAHIADMSQDLIDGIDHGIQSEDECRAVIADALSAGIRCAKNSKESTAQRQIYVLQTGTTVIGRFVITQQAADRYGFLPWAVTEETFDMSYLIGGTVTMTVPADYPVAINGHVLDHSYVTVDNIRYPEIEEFYDEYDLPYRVTYEAGPFLGELDLIVTDPQGKTVTINADTDLAQFYHNCTDAQARALDVLTEEFIERYVAFAGSSRNTSRQALDALMACVVEGSGLSARMRYALDGLQFGQSQKDELVSIATHHQVRLAEGKYMCDVTWEVDTTGRKGVVRTQTSARLIVVDTENGLRIEAMYNY